MQTCDQSVIGSMPIKVVIPKTQHNGVRRLPRGPERGQLQIRVSPPFTQARSCTGWQSALNIQATYTSNRFSRRPSAVFRMSKRKVADPRAR